MGQVSRVKHQLCDLLEPHTGMQWVWGRAGSADEAKPAELKKEAPGKKSLCC